ncbi:unnamed protein product [Macrosiphum euphorbiae]|uniref:Uncharacterized protein n=1 Tax=Macrosiphum euphorbiae TaxID=13131 RepID=A0AAV0WVH9_9HEMI|nr:unnamed protein product [Macrosiphum euphorbiae]
MQIGDLVLSPGKILSVAPQAYAVFHEAHKSGLSNRYNSVLSRGIVRLGAPFVSPLLFCVHRDRWQRKTKQQLLISNDGN